MYRLGLLALALGMLTGLFALVVPPPTVTDAASIATSLRTAHPSDRPAAAVASASPAVVRVLSYYYGTNRNGSLVPVPVACAGTGVLVGTTGINQANYVLTSTALVNPILPCEGAQAAFQQLNGPAQNWGIIRVEIWLDAAYTGGSAKQLGSIRYQVSPTQIATDGGPNAPPLVTLAISNLAGAPTHDLPVLLPPQSSDSPATADQTVIDLGRSSTQLLASDELSASEALDVLYPAAVDAGQLGQEVLPTPTKPPTPTPPEQTVTGGTPLPTQAPPTAAATQSAATPSTVGMEVSPGAPVIDSNGRLTGMVIVDSAGNHVVAPLAQVLAAIGPVSGKPGPVMTQWLKGLSAFYTSPPDDATAVTVWAALTASAPDFAGVAPYLAAARSKTTDVVLPGAAVTSTATPQSTAPSSGGGISLPLILGAIGLVLFALLLALILILFRVLQRVRRGRQDRARSANRGPHDARLAERDGQRGDREPAQSTPPMRSGARPLTSLPIDAIPTQKQPILPGAALTNPPAMGAMLDGAPGGAPDQLPTMLVGGGAVPSMSRGFNLAPQAAGMTDAGRKRAGDPNQDNILALTGLRLEQGRPQPYGLFIIADGMGGHADGREASRRTIEVLTQHIVPALTSGQSVDASGIGRLLQQGAMLANEHLRDQNLSRQGDMGTTLTAALVVGDVAYVANIGDSRTYVLNPDQGLRRITTDHSVVASLVAAGVIHPDDIYTHPRRNQIYRSLGGQHEDTAVDIFDVVLQPGDRLLLCSDGLWEMVRDPQIEAILRANADPGQTCELLVHEANNNGGEDNISVIVVRMIEAQPPRDARPGVHVIVGPRDDTLPAMG
jgi:serine/threonine protein phosphatase PrpC